MRLRPERKWTRIEAAVGSGGAGAITAQNKYGYKAKHGMRSVDEGVTAINEGATVLGFGFMDKEELGERLVQAWNKKHGS